MIENSYGNLTNDFILEQSRRVDKLIVTYNKIKNKCIQCPSFKVKARLDQNNI